MPRFSTIAERLEDFRRRAMYRRRRVIESPQRRELLVDGRPRALVFGSGLAALGELWRNLRADP